MDRGLLVAPTIGRVGQCGVAERLAVRRDTRLAEHDEVMIRAKHLPNAILKRRRPRTGESNKTMAIPCRSK